MKIKYESANEHRDEFPKVALLGIPISWKGFILSKNHCLKIDLQETQAVLKTQNIVSVSFPFSPACCQGGHGHGSCPALLGLSRGRCLG